MAPKLLFVKFQGWQDAVVKLFQQRLLADPPKQFLAAASSAQEAPNILAIAFRLRARANFATAGARSAGHGSAPERKNRGIGRVDDEIDLALERFVCSPLLVDVGVHVVSFAESGQAVAEQHFCDVALDPTAR